MVAALLGASAQAHDIALADETGPDFVVLPHGDTFQIDELSELAESVAGHLRRAGKSLHLQPAQAFETLHSRGPRTVNADRLRALTEQLHASVQQEKPERTAEIAYAIHETASIAPEALVDDSAKSPSVRYSITQACFEGIRAHAQLNKLAAARRLIDWCSGLTWLVGYVAFDLEGEGSTSVLGMCGSGTGCCIDGLSIVVSQCGAGARADIDCGSFRAEQYPVMYRCR